MPLSATGAKLSPPTSKSTKTKPPIKAISTTSSQFWPLGKMPWRSRTGANRMAAVPKRISPTSMGPKLWPTAARAETRKLAQIANVSASTSGGPNAPSRCTTPRQARRTWRNAALAHITSFGFLPRIDQQAVVISGTSTRSSISGNSTSAPGLAALMANRSSANSRAKPARASASLSPQIVRAATDMVKPLSRSQRIPCNDTA